MEGFTPSSNSAADINEERVLECRYVHVYYLLQAYLLLLKRQELPEVFETQVN